MKTRPVPDFLATKGREAATNRFALLVSIGSFGLHPAMANAGGEVSSDLRARPVVAALVAAFFFASTLCGCAKVMSYWPRKTETLPAAAPAPHGLEIESSGIPSTSTRHRAAKKTTTASSPVTGGSPENPGAAPSLTTPDVTLVGESDNGGAIEQSLNDTDHRLAHVDRHALGIQADAAWKEATGFVNAARQALTHRDYLTASGYAHKASALASKLPLLAQP